MSSNTTEPPTAPSMLGSRLTCRPVAFAARTSSSVVAAARRVGVDDDAVDVVALGDLAQLGVVARDRRGPDDADQPDAGKGAELVLEPLEDARRPTSRQRSTGATRRASSRAIERPTTSPADSSSHSISRFRVVGAPSTT